jgi:hypothetical protein
MDVVNGSNWQTHQTNEKEAVAPPTWGHFACTMFDLAENQTSTHE